MTPDVAACLAVVLATIALLILVFARPRPKHPGFWVAVNLTTYGMGFSVLLT